MTLDWREHPAARHEFLDALIWYEDQEHGLGERLADQIAQGVRFIRDWPDAAPLYRSRARKPPVRSKGIDVFPYRIIYLVRDDEVIVLAYAHERPRWSRRGRERPFPGVINGSPRLS